MAFIEEIISGVSNALYSYILIVVLVLGGLYFTIRTRFAPFRLFKDQIKSVTQKPTDGKSVSSFQALMVSTASRVGTGNIIGVSTALCLGGFGSVFWMWIIALIGSASAFVESTLAQIFKKKKVVLSHFHPDHVWNLICTTRSELYVSENTRKYVKQGTIVKDEIVEPANGKYPELRVFNFPSCHAKGCLALQCGEYVFLGDATYSQEKGSKHIYNEQILKQMIDCIEQLDCEFIGLSHSRGFIHKKEDVLTLLKSIYGFREKGRSEISFDNFFYNDEIMEKEFEEEVEFKIVGSTEANSLAGKISNESPLGAALLGKGIGDIVEVEAQAGTMTYKVLKIDRSI